MATKIDFSKFTFTAEQIRDINELLYDQVMHAPDLAFIHTIFPGVVFDKEVGFLTGGGLVGKAGQGCDPTPQDYQIGTRAVTWAPKRWEVFISECAYELEQTAAVYALRNGTLVSDLTDTDYMAIVVEFLRESLRDFFYRIAWFGDVDAENVGEGGQITAGVDVTYFTLIDGFWKQLTAGVTANPALGVTIAANAEATKAEQVAGLTPEAAFNTLQAMYFGAPLDMRASGDMRFLVTQSVADAYMQYLQGKNIDATYRNLVDGVPALMFNGVPVIALPIWDSMIKSYQDLGNTYYKPHRAVLIEKLNLGIGVGSEDGLAKFDIWYDKTSRKNYVLAQDTIDAKLLNASRFVLAQ